MVGSPFLLVEGASCAGTLNVGKDRMSIGGVLMDRWSISPDVTTLMWQENAQCPCWFSLRASDAPPLRVDAFAHPMWPASLLYSFPSLRLMVRPPPGHMGHIGVCLLTGVGPGTLTHVCFCCRVSLGFCRMRPVPGCLVPRSDLQIVLDGLTGQPFEPLTRSVN